MNPNDEIAKFWCRMTEIFEIFMKMAGRFSLDYTVKAQLAKLSSMPAVKLFRR